MESWTVSQYQWHDWGQIRGGHRGYLDPHLTMSRDVESLPVIPDHDAAERVGAVRTSDPHSVEATFDPGAVSMMYNRDTDGIYRAASAINADGRAFLLGSQHANVPSLLHEILHSFEQLLHPSQKDAVLTAFRAAHPSSRARTWTEPVHEWFVRQIMAAVETGSIDSLDPAMKETIAYYAKFAKAGTMAEQRAAQLVATKAERASALAGAKATVKQVNAEIRPLTVAVRKATERRDTAVRALQQARARLGVDVLAARREAAVFAERRTRDVIRDERLNIKRLEEQLATGPARSRGGVSQSLTRARARLSTAEDALPALQKARVKAVRAHVPATRRKGLAAFEATLDARRAELKVATDALEPAQKRLADAEVQVGKLSAPRGKPGRGQYVPPTVDAQVQQVLDDLIPLSGTKTRPTHSSVDAASPFPLDQEGAYQTGLAKLLKSEDQAFTTQYYRRGRHFVERSINHQYFGLYPASYMWGKILPEFLHFLLKEPFGIRAPLGGLALANQFHRAITIEQNYNEGFRNFMSDNTAAWRFLSLLSPALPWEIPVNAPLWLRRAAEWDATRQARIAAGEAPEDVPRLTGPALANVGMDMLTYAIGPLQALRYAGGLAGMSVDAGNQFGAMISGAGEQLAQTLAQTTMAAGPVQQGPSPPYAPTAPLTGP